MFSEGCNLTCRLEYSAAIFSVAGNAARSARAPAGLDAEPLDLLIERRKRNLKALGRFRLVPVRAFEHVHNDSPFDFFENLE